MIVTFKSKAAGDVIQFGEVAKRLLDLMGKQFSPEGIITVEQLPDALARLKAAVAADRAQSGRTAADQDGDAEDDKPRGVSLSQRAVPLIDLLEYSLRDRVPVTWAAT